MRILVACESSGTVRNAFRSLGHSTWSCDLLPADDGSPYHYQGDCLPVIALGWDIVIAHPPCTHLAVSGSRHFAAKRADGRQQAGINLFMSVVDACERYASKWAIENPIGIMSTLYRKPNQIVQPWQFGDSECKATCLWTKGLPLLVPTNVVPKENRTQNFFRCTNKPTGVPLWKWRSKTFNGIANAMATQWS